MNQLNIQIITLLLTSTALFFFGYNFTFNTAKTISKYTSLSGYKEGSKMYKFVTSESKKLWMKIGGVIYIIVALLFFVGAIVLYVKKC